MLIRALFFQDRFLDAIAAFQSLLERASERPDEGNGVLDASETLLKCLIALKRDGEYRAWLERAAQVFPSKAFTLLKVLLKVFSISKGRRVHFTLFFSSFLSGTVCLGCFECECGGFASAMLAMGDEPQQELYRR